MFSPQLNYMLYNIAYNSNKDKWKYYNQLTLILITGDICLINRTALTFPDYDILLRK